MRSVIYKAVAGNTRIFRNNDGKENSSEPFVGVGLFENVDSQTYQLICKIDKNVDSPEFEANRIAKLLNSNTKYFSQKELDLKAISGKYHPFA